MAQGDSFNYPARVRFRVRVCCPPINVKQEDSHARRGKTICSRSAFRMSVVSAAIVFSVPELHEQLIDQLEEPTGNASTTMCTCWWVGSALDMASASHTVQPWTRTVAPSSTADVPGTEGIAEKRDWLFLVAKQIGSISGQKFQNTPL
jgi:hypothetical protein